MTTVAALPSTEGALIPVLSLPDYFREALGNAAAAQRLATNRAVLAYLTHLLTDYARSDRLYERTRDGVVRRPLVDIYRQASEAESGAERELALRRLGDLALFVAGILPNSLERSLVDVDYYIAMGSAAYGSLTDGCARGARVRALRSVFADLAGRFVDYVDLLAETVEQGGNRRQPDLMRLHELWSKTGSRRLGRLLVGYGVVPQRATSIN